MGKVESEEEDDAGAVAAKGTPTNTAKAKPQPANSSSNPVRKSTRARKARDPRELVGKAIEVKWDAQGPLTEEHVKEKGDLGTYYKALVSSYDPDTGLHKVQYVRDKVIAEHNLSHPRKPDFIPSTVWKLSNR